MTIESTASERLWSLAEAACGEMISDDQVRELETILQTDEQARAFYFAYCELHADMHAVVTEDRAMSAVREMLASDDLLAAENPPASPVLGFLGGTARWTHEYFSQPGPFSILAAAIFMVCMISILSILPAPTYERSRFNHVCTTSTSGTGFQGVDRDGKLNFVARITGLHNCRWSDNYLPPLRYAHLGLGRKLKLDSGLVEITYYNGAKLVLEGPVEFTVKKANACQLDVGKLIAKVSKRAVGFVVQTPTAKIVDLGTEFAVEVEQSGGAEVHIFRGEVLAQLTDRDGTVRRSIRLTAGKAMRFDDAGQTELAVDNRRFVRKIPAMSLDGKTVPVAGYEYLGDHSDPRKSAHNKTVYPDDLRTKLTDGVIGSHDCLDGLWVGWFDSKSLAADDADDSKPQPGIVFDLGKIIPLDAVGILYLVRHRYAIHAPDRLVVRLSDDGRTFGEPIEYRRFNDQEKSGMKGKQYVAVVALGGRPARFVQLDFYNDRQWTFLSEVRFYADNHSPDDAGEQPSN